MRQGKQIVIWQLHSLNGGLHHPACLQVEAPTGWPYEASGSVQESAYPTLQARHSRASVKPSQSELLQARAQIQQLKTWLSGLQSHLELANLLKTQAESAANTSAAELVTTRAERDVAVSGRTGAESALMTLQAGMTSVQQQLSSAVRALEGVRAEQTATSGQAAQAQTSLVELAAELADTQAARDAAESSFNQAELQHAGLQAAVTGLQQQLTLTQQALDGREAELAATDAQLSQAGFTRQHLPQDLAALHTTQQTAVQRSEQLQLLLDDARQQLLQTQRREGAAQEQLSAQQASMSDRLRDTEALVSELQGQLATAKAKSTSAEAAAQELEDVKGRLDTAEAAVQELGLVKEQLTDVRKDREEQVAGRQQAEQETQLLCQSLQAQEDSMKSFKEQAKDAAEQSGQEVKRLFKECTEAADKTAGMPFPCCKAEDITRPKWYV